MAAAEQLRGLSQLIDVGVLDTTVAAVYVSGSKEEIAAADPILRDLEADPDTWRQVPHILQNTNMTSTKFFALQVLEGLIKNRWYALSVGEREQLLTYIIDAVKQLWSNEASFGSERVYVNKLYVILVQIVKHEWPVQLTSFITSLVEEAKERESICKEAVAILKLLSEEVVDISRGEMTLQKRAELKRFLGSEYKHVHEFFIGLLSTSQNPDLIHSTLSALHAYVSWISFTYIFDYPLLESFLKFFSMKDCWKIALQCLTEVAGLVPGDLYDAHYRNIYSMFIGKLQVILPLTTYIIPEKYSDIIDDREALIQNLALFFTSFFKFHIQVLGSEPEWLLIGFKYLISISYIGDFETFKVCLDYWKPLVSTLFHSHFHRDPAILLPFLPGMVNPDSKVTEWRKLYSYCTSELRRLMIHRMAKPEKMLSEDENRNIIMKDYDDFVQYEIMRETLIYLVRLDNGDTKDQILTKLKEHLREDEAALDKLNGLCSAIGSLSGFMAENQENAFLVTVFTHLWELCQKNQGSNKAGVATNMMYVFGQYPWFFRACWNDLKDVMNMLLKYMRDTDPAVQDMACDTFSKIVQGCKPELVIVQAGEEEPFVSELLSGLALIIQALIKPYQLNSFYESVGNMIQAESDPQKRDQYLQRLMAPPNQKWGEIIGQARQSVESLKDLGVLQIVLNILQANNSAATSLGTYFFSQFSFIYEDMLFLYKTYSAFVSTIISGVGPDASKTSFVKRLRSVKREILKLIETFLDKAEEDQPRRGKQFVPLMILADYRRNVPDARESEVLSLFATIINKYKASMLDDVENIFTAVFLSTLEMINKNFEDYPEHRFKFFSLLRAIATFCFSALTKLSSQELKLVMDSIIWAFQHTERDIAEIGLNILLEMLKKFQQSAFCNQFFRSYFTTIEQEIFAVLTDTFHKPGFKLHVLVLHHLFHLVESDALTEPLWDAATVSYTNNAVFVREHTISLLSSSVPIVEVAPFVAKLFTCSNDLSGYQNIICDFLVQSKGFSDLDIKDLDAEEAAAEQKQEQDLQRIVSIEDAMVIGQCRI